jgi:repressor LexA
MGFSAVQSARAHLDALVEAGDLEKEPGKARGYRLPSKKHQANHQVFRIPLLGQVQAGALHAAIEAPEGHVWVASRFAVQDLFALRIRGESMSGIGILPRDVVIVRRQASAENGDVVVARVADEATVKTLRHDDGGPILCPENPSFEVIRPRHGDELEILGKVIEVRRWLDGTDAGADEENVVCQSSEFEERD